MKFCQFMFFLAVVFLMCSCQSEQQACARIYETYGNADLLYSTSVIEPDTGELICERRPYREFQPMMISSRIIENCPVLCSDELQSYLLALDSAKRAELSFCTVTENAFKESLLSDLESRITEVQTTAASLRRCTASLN